LTEKNKKIVFSFNEVNPWANSLNPPTRGGSGRIRIFLTC